MTLVYFDSVMLNHDTGSHPEHAGRLAAIRDQLAPQDWCGATLVDRWEPISLADTQLLHAPAYLAALDRLAAAGGGQYDADTVVSSNSPAIARVAAGAVVDATRRVLRGDAKRALCLVRPPGHHALADRAMGFCLLANVALAARWAIDHLQLERVLVVDFDVHHGNGTQALFYDDPRVGFLSMHRYPFWPGSGAADETGTGRGLGTTVNLPVAMGTSRDRILALWARELEDFARRLRPELVLVSAGFDAHRLDPIGSLGLETEDFEYLTRAVADVASAHCQGRAVSVLEGGYHTAMLADSVELHLRTWMEV